MKYLFAASTGGHLAQLVRLSAGMDASADSLWVTFRSPQSESLLVGKRVIYLPYIRPRDVRGVLAGTRIMLKALASEKFDHVISTGSAIALAVFPVSRYRGFNTQYIESVSRVDGPSVTGRIVRRLRLANTWTQHEGWSSKSWQLHDSVMSGFQKVSRSSSTDGPLRLFVTLGTIEGYRFDSLPDRLLELGVVGESTVWQLGHTTRDDLPGTAFGTVSDKAFVQHAMEADVVVTHAGVGTILKLLDMGIYPVVVTRRVKRNEHVDDHQTQIAALVEREELAAVHEADELTEAHLREAAGFSVCLRPERVDS
ncbi:glycosyltransferase [Marisediminicola senii]|uniref:glycosyltransferase n=1 Tax=Marisediminicola senii TaxID=2711233 RepID=UPI0013EB395F|nr:glycosyltransferase [Marisediminicola senii]